jgi:hypothetical protein
LRTAIGCAASCAASIGNRANGRASPSITSSHSAALLASRTSAASSWGFSRRSAGNTSHADPRDPAIVVHRIVPDRQAARGGVGVDRAALEREQRPHEPTALGRDRREPRRPGAAQKPQQHGLGLIARGVADHHARQAELVGERGQRGVARVAGGGLERAAANHRHAPDHRRGALPARPVGDRPRRAGRGGRQPVIDHHHHHVRRAGDADRGIGQRHRVRAARARHAVQPGPDPPDLGVDCRDHGIYGRRGSHDREQSSHV